MMQRLYNIACFEHEVIVQIVVNPVTVVKYLHLKCIHISDFDRKKEYIAFEMIIFFIDYSAIGN